MPTAVAALRRGWVRSQKLPYGNEAVLVLVAFLGVLLLPHATPGLIYVSGIAAGAPLILGGLGVVLIYRANRFINFAQLELAVWTGILFDGLARGRPLIRALRSSCGCVSLYPGKTLVDINFVVSLILAIAAAVLLNALIYVIVIRRFRRAGQLMLSLVTIYLAVALTGSQKTITSHLVPQSLVQQQLLSNVLRPPADITWTIAGFPLHLADLLLIACAVGAVVGLWWYLSRGVGVSIRASAENPNRAETLGISEATTSGRMWLLSGALAGVGGVLSTFNGAAVDSHTAATIPVEGFVIILVLVVLARFTNIWMVAIAGFAVGIVQVGVQVGYGSQAPLDVALVFVLAGLLMLQRDGTTS